MNHIRSFDKDWFQLLWTVCDGRGTAEECARLEERVLQDPEACRTYLLFQSLHNDLSWHSQATQVPSQTEITPSPGPHQVSPSPALSNAEGPRLRFAPSTLAWSILAASVLFAAYFITISWNMLGRERSDRLTASSTNGADDTVATITASVDAQWSDRLTASSTKRSDAVTRGQSLQLTSGLVELQLKQGTTLAVEGPAEWSIDGDNSATLTRGKLVARVPQQAVGFTLETPTAKIVDLGTEFGTVVSASGETSLHVLRGEVELAQNSALGKSQRVVAGEALKVSKTANGTVAVEKIPFDAPQVAVGAVEKPPRSPLDRWRAASEKLRTDPSLVAYYNFECNGNVLKNVLADRLHGEIATPRESVPRTNGRWQGKGALALGKDFATVAIPDHPDFVPGNAWSIALWLRPDALPPGRTYALVVGKCDFPKRSFGLWYHGRGTLEFGLGSTNGKQYSCAAAAAVALNRWHFVVGVIESGEIRFYVDGQQTGATRFPGQAATNSMPVTLGNSRERNNPHPFTGAVDELAIYRRALNAAEIQEMYEAGKPAQ